MPTTIQKWGNSHGVRFTKKILRDAHMRAGEDVRVHVTKGAIMIRKEPAVQPKCTLETLLARIPKDMLHNGRLKKKYREEFAREADLGPPVGKEIW